MAKQEAKSFKIGRDARTGILTTIEVARRHPDTHVVECMPKPGHGDAKKK